MATMMSLFLTASLLAHPAASPVQSGQAPPAPTVQQPPAGAPATAQAPETPAVPALPTLIAPVVPVPESYVIGKQDQVKVTVFEDESLNGTYIVDVDGTIMLPYVSRVPAAGLTQRQLQEKIRSALSPDIIRTRRSASRLGPTRARASW